MLKALLPKPLYAVEHFDDEDDGKMGVSEIPTYGNRRNWKPDNENSYGDGGAFPEIHIVQYPQGIGKPQEASKSGQHLVKTLDTQGRVAYDVIARQGHFKGRTVQAKITDLMPKEITVENDISLARPGKDEEEETAKRTALAILGFSNERLGSAKPIKEIQTRKPAEYIRYTPSMQGLGHNSGCEQRIIRMVQAPLDPLEPPRFKTNKKVPRGAPSPPAPVLHSPPRKLSQAEQIRWKIPPCISNWRNPKGYTIPLDKRLASDGRGLQETIINENFAKMSESLYIADRKAREAIEMRNALEKKMSQRDKEKKEAELRRLAQEAREERAGMHKKLVDVTDSEDSEAGASDQENENPDGDAAGQKEREEIRKDKKYERRRERNLQRAAPERRAKIKAMDQDRDISEKIALGLPTKNKGAKEVVYDQRLFNKTAGLDSGFDREDDTYNVYTERWNQTGESQVAKAVYRPNAAEDGDTYGDVETYKSAKKFVADRGFEGSMGTDVKRSGPVQFEKQKADPFGLDDFLKSAKSGKDDGPPSKRSRN